jgi:hypothetical protein
VKKEAGVSAELERERAIFHSPLLTRKNLVVKDRMANDELQNAKKELNNTVYFS